MPAAGLAARLLLTGLATCLLLPAAVRAQDRTDDRVRILELELAAQKRLNAGMQARLATLEAQMTAQLQMLAMREQRLEMTGNRQTQAIMLRPGAGTEPVGHLPGAITIGRRETVVRSRQIVLDADDIVLSGRRSIRLDAPDISIVGVRPPTVKGGGTTAIMGSQIGKN